MPQAFIDPPSPFASLADWEAFAEEMEQIKDTDPDAARYLEEARATIAQKKAEQA